MKKILLVILSVIMTLSLVACSVKKESTKDNVQSKNILFQIEDIKGKDKKEVNRLLGKPENTEKREWYFAENGEKAKECFTSNYTKNNFKIEVFFIEGKAGRITLTPNNTLKYPEDNKQILKQLGLNLETPTFENELVTRWQNKFNTSEIGINARENKITFILIILDEKYK